MFVLENAIICLRKNTETQWLMCHQTSLPDTFSVQKSGIMYHIESLVLMVNSSVLKNLFFVTYFPGHLYQQEHNSFDASTAQQCSKSNFSSCPQVEEKLADQIK